MMSFEAVQAKALEAVDGITETTGETLSEESRAQRAKWVSAHNLMIGILGNSLSVLEIVLAHPDAVAILRREGYSDDDRGDLLYHLGVLEDKLERITKDGCLLSGDLFRAQEKSNEDSRD